MADDLDRMAATRVISVVAKPADDESGNWELRVDYDEYISPWEAYGLLKAGVERMDSRLFERLEESGE